MFESTGYISQETHDARLGLPEDLQGQITNKAQAARVEALVNMGVSLEEALMIYPYDTLEDLASDVDTRPVTSADMQVVDDKRTI